MDRLYTCVSQEDFDPNNFKGLLVCSTEINEITAYTEHGYDTRNWDEPPIVFQITPNEKLKYATYDDVIKVAQSLDLPGSEDTDDFDLDYLHVEEVQAELTKLGFHAFTDYVPVSNYQVGLTCFWNSDSFKLGSRIDYIEPGEDAYDTPSSEAEHWIAEFETSNGARVRALGNEPKEAVKGVVEAWVEKFSPMTGADPRYILDYREDINVFKFEIGVGYAIGDTDAHWHKEAMNGGDTQFDDLFDISPTHRI